MTGGNSTGPSEAQTAACVSPVLTAGLWFEAESRPHLARIELPLSADEMVAALYGERHRLTPDDLATEEEVWGHVAVLVVQDGLDATDDKADQIRGLEHRGTLANPEWLALCRHRVAELTAGLLPAHWPSKSPRG